MTINNCPNCKHYLGGLSCLAFLDGIPEEILNGNKGHEKPLKNQGNDIVFEEIKNNTNDL